MNYTWGLLIGVIGAILLASILFKWVKKSSTRKTLTWFGVILVAVALFGYFSPTTIPQLSNPLSLGGTGTGSGSGTTATGLCPFQPTASYAAKDKFGTTSVSGTAYYDFPNAFTSTTAPIIQSGINYDYWLDNSSYYTQKTTFAGNCNGVNVQANSYLNTTGTLTGYDLVNRQATTNSAYNTSLGANAIASEEFTYQGTAHKSMMPFGGSFVVEYNSSISSVTCTGAQIVPHAYHVTYSVGATTRTYQMFDLSPAFDDGTGAVRTIDCQFQNGNSVAGAGAPYVVTFIPANYYVSNTGDIVLDTEKNANQDTTRTGLGQLSKTFYWS